MVFIMDEESSAEEFAFCYGGAIASIQHGLSDEGEVFIAGKVIDGSLAHCDYNKMPTIKLSVPAPNSLSDLLACARVVLPCDDLEFMWHYQNVLLEGDWYGWRLFGATVDDEDVDLYYCRPDYDSYEIIRLTRPTCPICFEVPLPASENEQEKQGAKDKTKKFFRRRSDDWLCQPPQTVVQPAQPKLTYVYVQYNSGEGAMEIFTGAYSRLGLPFATIDGLERGQQAMRISYDSLREKMIVHRFYRQDELDDERLEAILSDDGDGSIDFGNYVYIL